MEIFNFPEVQKVQNFQKVQVLDKFLNPLNFFFSELFFFDLLVPLSTILAEKGPPREAVARAVGRGGVRPRVGRGGVQTEPRAAVPGRVRQGPGPVRVHEPADPVARAQHALPVPGRPAPQNNRGPVPSAIDSKKNFY